MNEIVRDFLSPTVDRLGRQLNRNIVVSIVLKIDGEIRSGVVHSGFDESFKELKGAARILASDTAVPGRYKYALQCIFDKDEYLEGFSGVRLTGAVNISESSSENDYSGFMYTYNEWVWSKKLREV